MWLVILCLFLFYFFFYIYTLLSLPFWSGLQHFLTAQSEPGRRRGIRYTLYCLFPFHAFLSSISSPTPPLRHSSPPPRHPLHPLRSGEGASILITWCQFINAAVMNEISNSGSIEYLMGGGWDGNGSKSRALVGWILC